MLNFFLLNSDLPPPPIFRGILVHYCISGEKYLNVLCLHGKFLIKHPLSSNSSSEIYTEKCLLHETACAMIWSVENRM